jgi:hypothetical protein
MWNMPNCQIQNSLWVHSLNLRQLGKALQMSRTWKSSHQKWLGVWTMWTTRKQPRVAHIAHTLDCYGVVFQY